MKTYIAFFRGINVGGHAVLPMQELVAALESTGARKVRTHMQSGNAIFESAAGEPAQLSGELSAALMKRCHFETYVHVLGVEALARAIAENPFAQAVTEPDRLHLGFLASPPTAPDLTKLANLRKDSERFHLSGTVFYLHAPEGVGRSKLAANAEKILGVPLTYRSWRTVCKVMQMTATETPQQSGGQAPLPPRSRRMRHD